MLRTNYLNLHVMGINYPTYRCCVQTIQLTCYGYKLFDLYVLCTNYPIYMCCVQKYPTHMCRDKLSNLYVLCANYPTYMWLVQTTIQPTKKSETFWHSFVIYCRENEFINENVWLVIYKHFCQHTRMLTLHHFEYILYVFFYT